MKGRQYKQGADGKWVVTRQGMFGEAARQMAEDRGGQVLFICPNFAVIFVPGRGELTLWAK